MASVTRPAGLVKLMTQASGASRATRRAMSHGDGHRAQAVRDAARADGLLAEHALGEGDPLVVRAPFQAADADRGEDEVGAAQGLVEVGGGRHLGRVGHAGRLLGQDAGHGGQPPRVQVVQDDTVTRPSARSPRSAPYTSGTRNPPPPRIVSFTAPPTFTPSHPRTFTRSRLELLCFCDDGFSRGAGALRRWGSTALGPYGPPHGAGLLWHGALQRGGPTPLPAERSRVETRQALQHRRRFGTALELDRAVDGDLHPARHLLDLRQLPHQPDPGAHLHR